jgi:alpha-methylacyl-CoA racemase
LLYLNSFALMMKKGSGFKPQGKNLLDGGAHFYTCYKSKDGKWFAVGCIEPKFYMTFVDLLPEFDDTRKEKFVLNHNNEEKWPAMRRKLAELFAKYDGDFWDKLFKGTDACTTRILRADEALKLPVFSPILKKPDPNDHIWLQM